MSQKIENQLNLALDITEEERQKSESLDIGYDLEEKEWELIVKYSGTLERVRTRAVYVTELTGGYAIIQIKESQIKELAAFPLFTAITIGCGFSGSGWHSRSVLRTVGKRL